MDHFNNSFGSYPPFGTEDLQAYPFLGQTGAIEDAENRPYNILDNHWSTTGEPDLATSTQTSFTHTVAYESVAPATQYTNPVSGYTQPLDCSQNWSGYQVQPQVAGPSNQSSAVGGSFGGYYNGSLDTPFVTPFVNAFGAGAPTTLPPHSNMPLGYGGTNWSPSTTTFYPQNVYPTFQHGSGPSRAVLARSRRFQPYGMSRARTIEHVNAEAGPSGLAHPPVPYAAFPTVLPPGGLSETTANAVTDHSKTEEVKAPKRKRKRVAASDGKPRLHRVQMKSFSSRLRSWVKEKRGEPKLPSFRDALAAAVDEIKKIRPRGDTPFLLTGETKKTEPLTKSARRERVKRTVDRAKYEEISRCFPRERWEGEWTCPKLLAAVVEDLEASTTVPESSGELKVSNVDQGPSEEPEGFNADPGPSDEPVPSVSTPEAEAPDA